MTRRVTNRITSPLSPFPSLRPVPRKRHHLSINHIPTERRHFPARPRLARARERARDDETNARMWLFKRQKTPTELLRENKRMLDRSIREIDRERASMMSQEKKLIAEIKRMAKANQMGAVKVRRSKARVR